MHADWFIDHIDNPYCDHALEMLKSAPGASLENCYMKTSCKSADVAKLKPKDQNALTPREMRVELPKEALPSPQQLSHNKLDLLKCKK